jgi:Holliday junction DNA helicase RuvA
MIASITGVVSNKEQQSLVVEAGGIGYKIFTTQALAASTRIGENIRLQTYLQVREDAMVLFGFAQKSELEFFEMLITVSGVGPKVALSILSAGNLDMIKDAIAAGDVAVFTKVGGVGRKTAEKIIVELKEKVGALGYATAGAASVSSDLLIQALEQLGYSNKEVREVLPKVKRDGSVEDQLRQALRILGGR